MISFDNLQQKSIQLAVLTGFTGTAWFTIAIGPIHLFPFRIVVLMLWAIVFFKSGSINISHIKVRNYLRFLWFWFVYAGFSTLWAADKVAAFKHITFLFLCISLVFFIVYIIRNILDLQRLFYIWIIVFIALLPVGFWEVVTGNHLPNSGLLNVDEGYELYKFAPTAVFGNQNDYATFIALTIPMFYVSLAFVRKWYLKIATLSMLITGLLMLMFTTSRANYIGVAIGFIFWFLFLVRMKTKLKIVLMAMLLLIILAFSLSVEKIEFFISIWEDFNTLTDAGDEGVDIRGNLVKNGIYFGVMSAGIGVGAGNIEYYMEHYPYFPVGSTANVHNWWVEIFANYGVFIFIGYVIFYVSIIRSLYSIRKFLKPGIDRIICDSLLCGMFSFSISSLSSSSILAFNPHWIFFGLALAFINIKRNSYSEKCIS